MFDSFWKVKAPTEPRQAVEFPSVAQIVVQLGLVLLGLVIWGGLLVFYLNLTSAPETGSGVALTDPSPPPTITVVLPTDTSAPTETSTSTSTPTETPMPTLTPTLTPVPATAAASDNTMPLAATEPPTPTLTPTPTSTSTSTSTSTLTPTPLPPTDTPIPATNTPIPLPPTETPTQAASTDQVSFSQDVLPIFENRCAQCHGLERQEQGLVLLTYDQIIAGSQNGPVVIPGDVADSYLFEQISSGRMPKNGPRLLPAEIRTIETWINAGAPNN